MLQVSYLVVLMLYSFWGVSAKYLSVFVRAPKNNNYNYNNLYNNTLVRVSVALLI